MSPCAILEVASLSATGFGATRSNTTASARWFSVGGGARLRWQPTPHFGLAFDVDGVMPTQPYVVRINGVPGGGKLYQSAPIDARVDFGPEVQF